MKLLFNPHVNGKPTYFIDKILSGISDTGKVRIDETVSISNYNIMTPKVHTLREDRRSRWEVGSKIHFYRSIDDFHFAPVLKVESIQRIEIKRRFAGMGYSVIIDGRLINYQEELLLAVNDGFDSRKDFFEYFSDDFEGKIIHWTRLKY